VAVYSTAFIATQDVAGLQTYTVPTSNVAVVRQFSVRNYAGTTPLQYYIRAGQPIVIIDYLGVGAPSYTLFNDLRFVLTAGEVLQVYTQYAADVYIGGYLLD
jgi:hypothetical protein